MSPFPPPPKIAPPAEQGIKPFWSVIIPNYNRLDYLERALTSVLSQGEGAGVMEIEVVDDASTVGDPEALVRRVGGDHVSFFRQPKNVGAAINWNTGLNRSRGEWVHILHSDDIVFPGFYARLKTALEGRGELGAAFCRTALVDENERWQGTSELVNPTPGILSGFLEKNAISNRVCTPAIVIRRSVYEKLGGFRLDLPYMEDWEMWTRVAAQYPIWYEPEVLVAWRIHSHSLTTDLKKEAQDIPHLRRCIEVNYYSLPPDRADVVTRKAKQWLFVCAFALARHALARGEFKMALTHVREGLKCGVSLGSIKMLLSGIAGLGMRWARGTAKK